MKTSIKLFLSAVALAASSGAAFGQTVVTGTLNASNPTFTRPTPFEVGENCSLASSFSALNYFTHTANHYGGTFTINLDSSEFDAVVGLYNGPFDPANPCANAVEYDDDSGTGGPSTLDYNAVISVNQPAGNYTIVVTTYSRNWGNGYGAYTLTTRSIPNRAVTPVPVAGIPALAFTSLGLLGAAGFVSRRRKAKAEKA